MFYNRFMSEKIYNWNDICRDVDDLTPKEKDFDDVYTSDDIKRDLNHIRGIKIGKGILPEQGISDSRIQEYAVAQEIGEMDWFHEQKQFDRLFPDGEGKESMVFLSSEYDDFVNHVDAVCLVCNADTDFKPVPFALDMTYNTDSDGLSKKMSWRHYDRDINAPGFSSVKYFEDNFSYNPLIEKGRIAAMPRFVVGFSPEISQEITELRMSSTGLMSTKRDELSAKAKWCVLRELKAQSEQMLKFLEGHHLENSKLEKLYNDAKALDLFFGNAISAATEADEGHKDWINYPQGDSVYGAIMSKVEERSMYDGRDK